MQSQIRYADHLPLEEESGYSRRIYIDSCKLDEAHLQVRGELVDNRADYEDVDQEIAVHGMVVRLTINAATKEITRSEIALPQMAFNGICVAEMPAKAEDLVGVNVGKGFSQKISALFGATNGCMHLMTLLKAMAISMNQVNVWNHSFRILDAECPPESVGNAMTMIQAGVADSCHAWKAETGGVSRDFKVGNYGPMLDRCSPRLFQRWKLYKDESE